MIRAALAALLILGLAYGVAQAYGLYRMAHAADYVCFEEAYAGQYDGTGGAGDWYASDYCKQLRARR